MLFHLAMLLVVAVTEHDLFAHSSGLWSLPPNGSQLRWVEIHNLSEARTSGLFHVEVLARKRNAPSWQVEHLVPHLAITTPALRKSVVAPIQRGAVYPETFDYAFSAWQKDHDKGKDAPVCETTIDDCLMHTKVFRNSEGNERP